MRLLLALILSLMVSQAATAKSVALVIGNDEYQHLPPLAVAVADAHAYCKHLRDVRKFQEVDCLYNATKAQIDLGILGFLRKLKPGDTAMVVYSGHGVQLNPIDPETVFLIPVDLDRAKLEAGLEEFSLRQYAIQFDEIRAAVRRRDVRLSVFVLDNCRDNPLADGTTRTLAVADGLGRVPADRGEFIFFSASEGETAFDRIEDDDVNSPFTTAFIEAFQPNVPLTTVANQVEREVLARTRQAGLGAQRPRYDDNVEGPGCLEGIGMCSIQQQASKINQKVDKALASLDYRQLVAVASEASDNPRAAEIKAQIDLHHQIDAQHTELDFGKLQGLYTQMVRHPRREEVRQLIRRAILLDSCRDLQRFGWPCPDAGLAPVQSLRDKPEAPEPETKKVASLRTNAAPADPAVPPPSKYKTLLEGVDKASIDTFSLPMEKIQIALTALGFNTGGADGRIGPRTRVAIRAWRDDVGSPINGDGRLAPTEMLVLLIQASEVSPSSKALLGLFQAQGIGLKRDPEAGRRLLQEAIAEGFTEARGWLTQLEKL